MMMVIHMQKIVVMFSKPWLIVTSKGSREQRARAEGRAERTI